jgi:hypothetical protein
VHAPEAPPPPPRRRTLWQRLQTLCAHGICIGLYSTGAVSCNQPGLRTRGASAAAAAAAAVASLLLLLLLLGHRLQ